MFGTRPGHTPQAIFSICLSLSMCKVFAHAQSSIGRFSEAGLLEWMRFVIFRARSRSTFLVRFPSRRCFTLCTTVEVEPRIAKQYKCQYCCSCKDYCGKGMEGGKSVFASFFGWLKDREFVKKCVLGPSNKLLLVARHILTIGLQKCL